MSFIYNLILLWNVIVLGVYGIDKLKAKTDAWRIPEKALLALAVCLGGFGAIIGMVLFRHKTNHMSFRVVVSIALVLTYCVLINLK